jgi:beta-glucosidase
VDETRERGDAVTPAGPAPGWIQFRETDLGAGPDTLTVRVARGEPAPASVTLQAGADCAPFGRLSVPATGSRYHYTEVSVPLRGLADCGPADVYLVLDGPVRLAAFRIHP